MHTARTRARTSPPWGGIELDMLVRGREQPLAAQIPMTLQCDQPRRGARSRFCATGVVPTSSRVVPAPEVDTAHRSRYLDNQHVTAGAGKLGPWHLSYHLHRKGNPLVG
jgi:hypothetical protein